MHSGILVSSLFAISLSACGISQSISNTTTETSTVQNTHISITSLSETQVYHGTFDPIQTFTPLPGPCSTPEPNQLNDFINRSITIKNNEKTLVLHVTSRFWIYLDDRIYPLRDLLKLIPAGLIGYVSNGSIRGPHCYPVMFEAVREGRGLVQLIDFHLRIIVVNNTLESPLPLN
jgi:hypothetical protein